MFKNILIALFLIFALEELCVAAEKVKVTGKVKQPTDAPVPDAMITVKETGISVRSGTNGEFELSLSPGTYTIFVEAVGFEVHGESLRAQPEKAVHLEVLLARRPFQFEELVYASEDSSGTSVSSPTTFVNPQKQVAPPSVLDAVTDVPGVAAVGQGGLFQVPAIRGASRERILLMLEGVRITSERRTGPSFSFVEPLLLERLAVTRGPAPILYGSNGESGLIQAFVIEPSEKKLKTSFQSGYQTNSAENWQVLTLKDGTDRFQYALGFGRRSASDYEAGNGQAFPAGFSRYNLVAKGRYVTSSGLFSFLVLPSWTNDIEKSSNDFQIRPTLYPEERHQIYLADWQSVLFHGTYDLQGQVWYHPSSLITRDDRVTNGVITSRAEVFNDTDDYGVRFRAGSNFAENWQFWAGFDFFGRGDVNAREKDYARTESGLVPTQEFFSIRNGSYRDTGIFATANGRFGTLVTNTGIRFQRVASSNNAGERVSASEYSWSGNLGLSYPLNSHWDATLNLGRGIRPATLSEKFFTGQTGRGSVTGNPDLKTESNFELDGGARFHRSNAFAGVYLFRNRIHDFIDRVSTTGEAFTFVNQADVTIKGLELEGFYSYFPFRFYGSFHKIVGSDQSDSDINDIPPTRLLTGIEYEDRKSRWSGSFEMIRQFEKSDPGPVENPLEAALLVNLKASFKVSRNVAFGVSGSNLTDEVYFASADDRAPYSPGRTFGLELILTN